MKTAAAIRHVQFHDLGAFENVLVSGAYHIQYGDMGIGDLRTPASLECDLLVVVGVPIGAYEEQRYPLSQPELLLADSHVPE